VFFKQSIKVLQRLKFFNEKIFRYAFLKMKTHELDTVLLWNTHIYRMPSSAVSHFSLASVFIYCRETLLHRLSRYIAKRRILFFI
jgi:hypothetical protein